jgi:membrane-associated phospholipid phosphatase
MGKKEVLEVFRDNQFFLIPFFIMLLIFSSLVLFLGNSGLFHLINNNYSTFADYLFLSFSQLGDGIIAFSFVFLLLWISFRQAFTLLTITLLITILFYLLKQFIFYDFSRPATYFGEKLIRMVPGYTPPRLHTFPSGHAATAFSVYLFFAIIVKQNGVKFGLFIIALLVAYSRIYLSAHFPADVICGSLLAVIITVSTYVFFRRINNSWIDQKFVIHVRKFFRRQIA